jgi:hypothetical protein
MLSNVSKGNIEYGGVKIHCLRKLFYVIHLLSCFIPGILLSCLASRYLCLAPSC